MNRQLVVVVTGGGSPIGIGKAIAEGLLDNGARVGLLDIDEVALGQTTSELSSRFGADHVVGVPTDVTDPDAVDAAVAHVRRTWGSANVLVNNAGIFHRSVAHTAEAGVAAHHFWDVPVSSWRKIVDVNFTAAFLMARAVVPDMISAGWGRVIAITTSLDSMWISGSIPYGSSKAGHEAMAASMARDLAGTGVTVNVVQPGGPTRTRMTVGADDFDERMFVPPSLMAPPINWIVTEAPDDWTGHRVNARRWAEASTLPAQLTSAVAPAAWPQLGSESAPMK